MFKLMLIHSGIKGTKAYAGALRQVHEHESCRKSTLEQCIFHFMLSVGILLHSAALGSHMESDFFLVQGH